MKKKVIGIILLIVDAMAIFGGLVNGSWAELGNENIITAATQVIIPIVILIIAIRLIVKSQKSEDKTSVNQNEINDYAKVISSAEERLAQKAEEKENQSLNKDDLLKIFSTYFAPNKDFYSVPNSDKFTAYFNAINSATEEIIKDRALLSAATGWTVQQLGEVFNEKNTSVKNMNICALIFLVGKYSVIKDCVYCVDFADRVPNCIALYLLLIAQKQPQDKRGQMLDAGDGCDNRALSEAIQSLKICDPAWSPEIC